MWHTKPIKVIVTLQASTYFNILLQHISFENQFKCSLYCNTSYYHLFAGSLLKEYKEHVFNPQTENFHISSHEKPSLFSNEKISQILQNQHFFVNLYFKAFLH